MFFFPYYPSEVVFVVRGVGGYSAWFFFVLYGNSNDSSLKDPKCIRGPSPSLESPGAPLPPPVDLHGGRFHGEHLHGDHKPAKCLLLLATV